MVESQTVKTIADRLVQREVVMNQIASFLSNVLDKRTVRLHWMQQSMQQEALAAPL